MAPNRMAGLSDFPNKIGVPLCSLPYHKEGGSRLMSREYLNHTGCVFRVWTVVKSQCDNILIRDDASQTSQHPSYGPLHWLTQHSDSVLKAHLSSPSYICMRSSGLCLKELTITLQKVPFF